MLYNDLGRYILLKDDALHPALLALFHFPPFLLIGRFLADDLPQNIFKDVGNIDITTCTRFIVWDAAPGLRSQSDWDFPRYLPLIWQVDCRCPRSAKVSGQRIQS